MHEEELLAFFMFFTLFMIFMAFFPALDVS